MFTVALIGADGSGKSTISRRLENVLPRPVKYVYMGVNYEASNFVLPTTKLMLAIKKALGKQTHMGGPPDPFQRKPLPRQAIKRLNSEVRSAFHVINLIAEEWYRQLIITYFLKRGYIVLFDRHFFFDYYARSIANQQHKETVARYLHGCMLSRYYPKPDLVICLDAPAEVLYARKQEGSIHLLEQRRQEYLQIAEVVKNFVLIDVTLSADQVTQQVTELIWDFYKSKQPQCIQVA